MLIRNLYYLRKVLKQQWLSSRELENIQKKMLRSVIVHAYKYVPFYKKKWNELGIKPEDIKDIKDLKKLPVIKREDLVKNFNQFIALNYRHLPGTGKIMTRFTSGTSGFPMEMIFDGNAKDYLDTLYLRSLLSVGYNPRKSIAFYWHEPFEKKITDFLGLVKKIYVSCSLTEEEQIKFLQEISPDYIHYYPCILYSIAKKMKFEGISLNPKTIFTTGNVLSNKMRKVIQNTFNAPIFDWYGAGEFNRIAWECKERMGYHIDADSIVMEIVENNEDVSSGERGSVMLTGLANFYLPLIRYEIGDTAISTNEMCSCGRKLPLVKSIEGRTEDLIKLKGEILSPKSIIDSIADIPEIYKFQILQMDNKTFTIDVALLNGNHNILKIRDKFEKIVKRKVKVKVVKDIAKTKGGKRKLVRIQK